MVYRPKRKAVKVPKKTKKQIMSVIKAHEKKVVEVKYLDDVVTWAFPLALGYEGAVHKILMPVRGIGQQQRIGDKIVPKRLELTLILPSPATSVEHRFIVFKWHPDTYVYSDPTILSLVDATGSNLSTNRAPYSMLHPKGSAVAGMYTILKDVYESFSYYGSKKANPTIKIIIPLKGVITFAENDDDEGINQLFIAGISNRVYSSQDQPTMLTRFLYTDQ